MPQHRKKPFSGKKKKEQIIQKRQRKNEQHFRSATTEKGEDFDVDDDDDIAQQRPKNSTTAAMQSLMEQPSGSANNKRAANSTRNRYNLQFTKETKQQLAEAKNVGFAPIAAAATNKELEIGDENFKDYDFPVRPHWNYKMDKETLDRNENKYFREYVAALQNRLQEQNKEFSLFEMNLETWRQLWRVLEFSDILLIIVDVRFASLMFPPALYQHITVTLKKRAILVLNKVDLVPPEVVVAWRHYFLDNYAGISVILFASYLSNKKRASKSYKRNIEGVYNIYRECLKLIDTQQIDLTKWEQKILEDLNCDDDDVDDDDEQHVVESNDNFDEDILESAQNKLTMDKQMLTIGCIGFPNVGKSSLINALKGKKVVSVSRTPGHTKHFQTIFITNDVRLCDCPGLVFPSATPKYLQVLYGSYPISQLQVPYPSLKFMAEHLNLPKLLKLQLPEDFDSWSSVAVCEAWAFKRGFLTAKAARPDRYRAANHLLRMCLAGHILLHFYPPNFETTKDIWLQHAEVEKVILFLNKKLENSNKQNDNDDDALYHSEDSENAQNDSNTDADEVAANDVPQKSNKKTLNAFALLDDDDDDDENDDA